jgi:predicted transcriptional regulator
MLVNMKSLLIQLDDPTYSALERIAPSAQRKRAQFIRAAIRRAIRETEEEHTRLAYLAHPDSAADADDWATAEEWKA